MAKKIIHGKNCKCHERSPEVEKILKEISSVTGSLVTETVKVIEGLRKVSTEIFSGQIDDVVKVAEAFLTCPVEDLDPQDLKLDDPEKRVGNFFVRDLSDVPGLDVTKVVDFSDLDTSSFQTLKFSFSVPTVEVTKNVSNSLTYVLQEKGLSGEDRPVTYVGNNQLQDGEVPAVSEVFVLMRILVNRKGFAYLPAIDNGVKSREDAMDKLKNVKSLQPITYDTDFQKAKKIAYDSYKSSKKVAEAVSSSKNTYELIDALGKIGVILYEEVDIEKQVKSLIAEKAAADNAPIYEDTECGSPVLVVAPFNSDEVKEIEKDCCQESPPVIAPEEPTDQLSQLEDSSSPNSQILNDLNDFVDGLSNSTKAISDCANEKQNAINAYYWYIESRFLNEIALTYAAARYLKAESFYKGSSSLYSELLRKIEISSQLKQQENLLYLQTYKRLYGEKSVQSYLILEDSDDPGKLKLDGIVISSLQRSTIEKDTTFKSSVKSIRYQYDQNEQQINLLNSQIQNLKNSVSLPSLSLKEAEEIMNYVSGVSSVSGGKIAAIRSVFSIDTNPISNQVGFSQNDILNLRVHSIILDEAKTLFSLVSPEQNELQSYILPLEERTGYVADQLWKDFYSANRIDKLFTYQEQGYKSPKPQFNDFGDPLSQQITVKVKNPLGGEVEQNVDANILNLQVDQEAAVKFWSKIEEITKQKVILKLNFVKESQIYIDYLASLKAAAEEEAKYVYSVNVISQKNISDSRSFSSLTNSWSVDQKFIEESNRIIDSPLVAQYKMVYESLKSYQDTLNKKISDLESFIEVKKKCIADQEETIAKKSLEFAKKVENSPGNSNGPTREDCKSKLGSDPFGLKPPSPCPGITKNCYWEEYTKLMQLVSLMPIPDDIATGQLSKRLFRYYPVGIQIPVPTPVPVTLPTLAMGIPDTMISIPLPLIWKHIITISTPLGIFVVWIATCGPVPSPYVMYIDEKMQPCFLVTGKGPISIPAKSLKVTDIEEKSLFELLSPLPELFKVPVLLPPFQKLLGGNGVLNMKNPDGPENVIDAIREKVKNAAISLKATDPWKAGTTGAEKVRKLKERANKALKQVPPDIPAIEDALKVLEKAIDKQIDSINVKPIKIPKNPKKLVTPVIGPAELVDSFNKILESGGDFSKLGLGVPTISLREKVKVLIDRDLSSNKVKESFTKLNQEISNLESKIRYSNYSSTQKAELRAEKLKEVMKVPVQNLADKIDPKLLGFISIPSVPIPLPFPCYDNITVEPIPPYILEMIAVIKTLPEIIESIPNSTFARALSRNIDLSSPLPRVEDVVFFTTQSFLSFVPDLKFPDPSSLTLFKSILMTSIQNFFKLKIRLPNPGTVQVTISSQMIKDAVKGVVKGAFAAITTIILQKVTEAVEKNDITVVLAVAAIIKGIFGTELGSISGEDIKAFLVSTLETIDDFLEDVKAMIPNVPSLELKSIKETLFPSFPPKIFNEGPFMEIDTEGMLQIITPLIQSLAKAPLPFPLVLLAASQMPGRMVVTKIYPIAAKEILPSWDKLSLNNLPFVIWLDQLIATSQKTGGLFSDYVLPYYLPDA